MTPEQRLAIEQQCHRLVIAFATYNDAGKHAELAEQFCEDGLFARPTAPDDYIKGRQAIKDSFDARPADRVARHLLSNILVDVTDDNTATGSCYALLYTASPDNLGDKGLIANARQMVGDFSMDYRNTDEGWKISRLSGRIVMIAE